MGAQALSLPEETSRPGMPTVPARLVGVASHPGAKQGLSDLLRLLIFFYGHTHSVWKIPGPGIESEPQLQPT